MARPAAQLALAVSLCIAAAAPSALGGPGGPDADRAPRDQVKALQMSVDWLGRYPEHLWVGVDLPGPCERLDDGRRSCPIAIELRAWTFGSLVPWRCEARALLPAPGSTSVARRTSAQCDQLPDRILAPGDPRRS